MIPFLRTSWLRVIAGVGGIFLVVLAATLPGGWYDAIPTRPEVPAPPIKGVTLLRIALGIEGLALLWLWKRRWSFRRLAQDHRLPPPASADRSGAAPGTIAALVAITALGLLLRVLRLGADLWLDEITPLLDYGGLPIWRVFTTYLASNNHLLNTALVNLATGWLGEREWVVRLPAVFFGVATIPGLYWVGRVARLAPRTALAASLLLAVSYHHIFFSQNSRGYSAHLFLSVIASALLVKGLEEDRPGIWLLYISSMVLNFAALMTSGFVLAAHVVVGGVAVYTVARRGGRWPLLLRRLAAVFAVIGLLGFHVYAAIVPQAYAFMRVVYPSPASGFSPFSAEFWQEVARGLSEGFAPGLVLGVLPFLMVAGLGFVALLRRHWPLTVALSLPLVLTAGALIAQGLIFSPRFFLLVLPVVMLTAAEGLVRVGALAAAALRRGPAAASALSAGLVIVVVAVSLASLKGYYTVPKQAYRASIAYLEARRQPGEVVIVVYLAEKGYRYYGRRLGLPQDGTYVFVRSVEALDAVIARHGRRAAYLVTTFPRALRLLHPELAARMQEGWMVERTFRGTIGDGHISIWRSKETAGQ